MAEAVLPAVRGTFRAITCSVAPGAAELDAAGWARLEQIVEDALAPRPASVRRQLKLFVRAVGVLCRLRHGRSLEQLPEQRRTRFLQSLERAPVLLLRRGFWGVRTLAYMGFYGQRRVQHELGYRAVPGGWSRRGIERRGWPERDGAGAPEPDVPVRGYGIPDFGDDPDA